MGAPMRQQPQRSARLLNSGVGRGLRAAYAPGASPSRALPVGASIVSVVGFNGLPELAWTNTQKGANGTVFIPTPTVASSEWTFLVLAKCATSSAVEAICDFNDGISPTYRTSLARGAYSSGNIGTDARPYAPDYNSGTLWDNTKPGLLVVTISTAANALKIYYQGALISSAALSSSGVAKVSQIQLFSKNGASYTDPLTIGGSISLVAFWDRAIAAQEVAALYQNPWALFDSGSSSSAYQAAIASTGAGGAQLRIINPSGGIALAGVAAAVRNCLRQPAGGLQLAGTAQRSRSAARVTTGGIQLAGASVQARTRAAAPSGGMQLSGAASITTNVVKQVLAVVAAGGIVLAGTAARIASAVRVAVGGLTVSGSANYTNSGTVPRLSAIMRRRARPRNFPTSR